MIAEMSRSYSAVSCSRCNEPIPVSSRVASIQNDAAHSEKNVPHSFVARCKLCEYESVYALDAVKIVEGEPRKRRGRTRAARA